jgi:hypothetical protein
MWRCTAVVALEPLKVLRYENYVGVVRSILLEGLVTVSRRRLE